MFMGAIRTMRTSKGEQRIIDILKKENIDFHREKTMPGLKSSSGTPLRMDFYIETKNGPIVIEFQGQQHYQEGFGSGRRGLLKQKGNDQRKTSYCLARDIPLYCIPYTDLEKLFTFKDLTQEKYRVRTKYHNTYMKP